MGNIRMPHLFFEDRNDDPFYSDFTITLWIKPYDVANTTEPIFQLDRGDGSSWGITYYNGLLVMGISSDGLTLQPTLNEWNFISIVWNCESSTVWIYHNGELYDDINTAILNTLGNVESYSVLYTLPYFALSDFRIYATSLSSNDIKSLYQNEAYVDSNGVVLGPIH